MQLISYIGVAFSFMFGLLTGMPIGFVLLSSGLIGITFLRGWDVGLGAMMAMPFARVYDISLAVIPLYILMGFLAFQAGISVNAYKAAYQWIGHLKGGLAMATVLACAGFAATSGSSVATSASIGKIAMPEMKRYNYDDSVAAGTIASAGLLGIMIPPSIMLVVYGIITQQNIGRLLIAGILPGILTATVFLFGIYLLARYKPELMPAAPKPFSWKERLVSLRGGWGIVVLFGVVIGGIYGGIFTPTEAAAVGAVLALGMAVSKKGVRWANLREGALQGASTASMIFLILIGAGLFSQYLALSGAATGFARAVVGSDLGQYGILALVLLMYVPLGMVLEPISMCLLTLPIIFPIIQVLGFNGIWFGIIITKMSELANITPPIGVNVFVIKGVSPNIATEQVFKGCLMFMAMEVITLGILIAFPQISLFLPDLMF